MRNFSEKTPQPEFGCWFARQIRQYTPFASAEEYAQSLNIPLSHVLLVIAGKEEPCKEIIENLNLEETYIEIEDPYYVCEERVRIIKKKAYIAKSYVEEQETDS